MDLADQRKTPFPIDESVLEMVPPNGHFSSFEMGGSGANRFISDTCPKERTHKKANEQGEPVEECPQYPMRPYSGATQR